jgi:dTDP-glucose pyrophosphorylase
MFAMHSCEKTERQGAIKGIILATDSGTELYPLTHCVAKQLLPVHDKPMIYYPLSTLLLAGVRDILVLSTAWHLRGFMELLGNGSRLGVSLSYAEQPEDDGIVDSLLTAERFIGDDSVCLIRGDCVLHGDMSPLREAAQIQQGATFLACNPPGEIQESFPAESAARTEERNGLATFPTHAVFRPRSDREGLSTQREQGDPTVMFDSSGKALKLQQHLVAIGGREIIETYFFGTDVVDVAKSLLMAACPAAAGGWRQHAAGSFVTGPFVPAESRTIFSSEQPSFEEECGPHGLRPSVTGWGHSAEPCLRPPRQPTILPIAREYLLRGQLQVRPLAPNTVCLEARTHAALRQASNLIAEIEKRQGVGVGCIEEAAFQMGFIGPERLQRLARDLPPGSYRAHLIDMAEGAMVHSGRG